MAERRRIDALDDAVQAMLASRDAGPAADPELAALLRLASALRLLPRESFRARLRTELEQAGLGRSRPPSFTIHLPLEQPARFIAFVRDAFGAEYAGPAASAIAQSAVRIGDSRLELADASSARPPMPTALHLYVENADAVYAQALRAGATSMHEPVDQPYGDREASVKDVFGNHWYIATHLATSGSSRGPAHIPEGLQSVTPYLHPRGAGELIDFLHRAFDAQEVFRAEAPDGAVVHAKVRIGESMLEMGEAHGPYQPMPVALHLHVADVDATYRQAVSAGARPLLPLTDRSGHVLATVADPGGNVWYIDQHR